MKIEKTRKQILIDRLLEAKQITKEEADILLEEVYNMPYVPIIPMQPVQPQPFPQPSYPNPLPVQTDWRDRYLSNEMERRRQIAEACPCNPKNNGSGICGCTLTGPVIIA